MKYELLGYKKCSTCKGVEKILKDKGYTALGILQRIN